MAQSEFQCAKIWKFRQPNEGEPEADYRKALSDHIRSI